jgi:hypothetical protein
MSGIETNQPETSTADGIEIYSTKDDDVGEQPLRLQSDVAPESYNDGTQSTLEQQNAAQQDAAQHAIDANNIIQPQQQVYNSGQYTTTSKSQMNTFAIPKGTLLYHGSRNLETFDTTEITLSGDNYTAIFSENITVAQGYTMNCNLVGPSFEGYVHRFSVINTIDNVLIVSPTDRKLDWSGDQITQNYCRVQDGNHYKAIGFIVNDAIQIAICNPRDHLKYEGTVRCVAPSTYSEEYQFTK